MSPGSTAPNVIHFAGFRFDPVTAQLSRDTRTIPLEPQPAMVLAHFLSSPNRIVTRQELARALWGSETHVSYDDGLNYCIRQIRVALGDDVKQPRFIVTVPRRGYRFIAPVAESDAARLARVPTFGLPAYLVVVALAVVTLTIAAESRPNNHHEIAISILRAIHNVIF